MPPFKRNAEIPRNEESGSGSIITESNISLTTEIPEKSGESDFLFTFFWSQ